MNYKKLYTTVSYKGKSILPLENLPVLKLFTVINLPLDFEDIFLPLI